MLQLQQIYVQQRAGIDLPGVYVDNPATQCNIFDTCDDTTPLGEALGLTTGETVEVADERAM